MIKDNVTLGLRVQTLTPAPHSTDIDVNTSIRIHLNHDINPKTVAGSFSLIEDEEWLFESVEQLQDRKQFKPVTGAMSYQDRVLTFKPRTPLKEGARYIVLVKAGGLKTIDGKSLLEDFVGVFYTECQATLPPATIETPKFGLITADVPTFTWGDQKANSYLFQISTSHEFESLVFSELIIKTIGKSAKTSITPMVQLRDGLYYARVRASNGHWSLPHQFYIEGQTGTLVSEEDFDESFFVEEYLDQDLFSTELVESFPRPDAINTRLNTALVYGVFTGRITVDDIDWSDTFVVGELFDEEMVDAETHRVEAEEHGFLEGQWYLIYDENLDQTYVLFDLRGKSEEEGIQPSTEPQTRAYVFVDQSTTEKVMS